MPNCRHCQCGCNLAFVTNSFDWNFLSVFNVEGEFSRWGVRSWSVVKVDDQLWWYIMLINNFWEKHLKCKFFFCLKLFRWFYFTGSSFTFNPIYGFQIASCPHNSQYDIFSKSIQWIRVVCFQYPYSNWYNHLLWDCSSS